MLDATGKKLLRLLELAQPPEVRQAAARVLGELSQRDAEIQQALCELLDDPDTSVRTEVVSAIGKLRIDQALPQLLDRVQVGGVESEAAAQAAARLGAKGIHALQQLMTHVAPGLRRRIAGAIAAGGTTSAGSAAVEALLDKDPGVVDATARSLIGEVSSLSQANRRTLADHILELLAPKKGSALSPASEVALVRLLASLHDPRADKVMWDRVGPSRLPEVRATAMQALGTRPPPQEKNKLQMTLACAGDPDFRIAAAALMLLKGVPVQDRLLPEWLTLFDAADPAVRRFAIEKLGERDTPEVAAALVQQLGHPDRTLRDAALASLRQLKHGREALAKALLDAATPEDAWTLARAQAPFVKENTAALQTKLLGQACDYWEANDRRADPLFFLLREWDARALRDRLEERALALRKKKSYEKAILYLRLLARDPACAENIRLELAACGLKVSEKDLASEARAGDPSLQQFARLIHNHERDPVTFVEQAKWLDTEDLFYLGFHFIEAEGREKEFGAHVLRLVLKRAGRSKMAKDAKSKLRSAGMD